MSSQKSGTTQDPFAFALPRLSAGIRLDRASARDWAGALRNLAGIPADESEWFGVDGWLNGLGDEVIGRDRVLERLDAMTPVIRLLEVPEHEWRHADRLPEGDSGNGYRELLVILETAPDAPDGFRDSHWDDQPGVLMHLRLVSSGRFLKLVELQSEWHQRGARGLRVADPAAFRDAAEARRRAAEGEIDRLMGEGGGAAFVAAVAEISGSGSAARRIAWSALNGNDCGEAVAAALNARTTSLGPVLDAFRQRWDACQDVMRSLGAVPLAPMRSSWPRAGIRLAMALASEAYDGLVLPSGDEVAESLGADETIHSLGWRSVPDGRIEISAVSMDVNASRAIRPSEVFEPGNLAGTIGEEAAEEILSAVSEGATSGDLDADWFSERQEVAWENKGLRRFYNTFLPRMLADEARRAGAEVFDGGAMLRHTPASRAAWCVPPIGSWVPPDRDWDGQDPTEAPGSAR